MHTINFGLVLLLRDMVQISVGGRSQLFSMLLNNQHIYIYIWTHKYMHVKKMYENGDTKGEESGDVEEF